MEAKKPKETKPKSQGGPQFDEPFLPLPNDKDVFLKLTRHRSDRDVFAELLIRPSAIESICAGMDGLTVLNGNRYYSVRETPEEIFEMLEVAKDASGK